MKKKSEKWENFWYYNKAAVLIGIAVIFFLGVGLLGNLVNADPDLKITTVTQAQQDNIGLYLKKTVAHRLQDINGDDYIELSLRGMTLEEDLSTDENNQVQNSINSQLANRGATLFIFDKLNFDRYIRKDAFEPLDTFFDVSNLGDRAVYKGDIPIALNLTGSKLLTEAGAIGDEFYGMLLFKREADADNAEIQAEYENAVTMLLALLES